MVGEEGARQSREPLGTALPWHAHPDHSKIAAATTEPSGPTECLHLHLLSDTPLSRARWLWPREGEAHERSCNALFLWRVGGACAREGMNQRGRRDG